MGILEAAVLGVVQGLTEFLPISSDGHLILVPSLLGWERFGLGFDVVIHFGTLLATLAYFRNDVRSLLLALLSSSRDSEPERRLAWMLLGATMPSIAVVLALEPFVEGVEARPVEQQISIAALGLLVTSVTLGASELIAASRSSSIATSENPCAIPVWMAFAIGFAQGFAALPGVSRSGTTIAAGQAFGLSRGTAARFSFLMSIPIVAAATAKKLFDVAQGQGSLPGPIVTAVGVGVTTLVGYTVIRFLMPFVRNHSLWWFAAYTAVAGILLLATFAPR